MGRNLVLMRPLGIEVSVHWSWLLLAFLIASSLATGWFPALVPGLTAPAYWIAAALGAIGLFASILIHECCHALVGRSFAMPMDKITLFLFGGVAHMEDEPPSPKAEFLMAIAGPAASVVLALIFGVSYSMATRFGGAPLLQALLSYLASINVVVAAFNMLPGYPLDGGRVLRSALWHFKKDIVWATRISSGVGQGVGWVLVGLGFVSIISGQPASGLWSSLLGFLLLALARSSYMQLLVKQTLHGKPAEAFMNTSPTVVQPHTTILDFMRSSINQAEQSMIPVVRPDGSFLGCVDMNDVRRFPEAEWGEHRVGELVQRCSEERAITPETDAEIALTRMARSGARELLVVREGQLIGVLTRNALMRYLALQDSPTAKPAGH